MNADDAIRDQLLRYLYERHKTSKSIAKLPVGIRNLQSEMKSRHGLKQQQISSNLDYLVQVGWVREVVRERNFTTSSGMEVSQEQVKYKISDVGINHLEAGTIFKRPEGFSNINVTNVKGVTIIGNGNVVNTQFTDLDRALDELDKSIAKSTEMTDAQKLDAGGDLSTIRSQIAKQNPNKPVIEAAWESLKGLATIASLTGAAHKVGVLIAGLIGS